MGRICFSKNSRSSGRGSAALSKTAETAKITAEQAKDFGNREDSPRVLGAGTFLSIGTWGSKSTCGRSGAGRHFGLAADRNVRAPDLAVRWSAKGLTRSTL